MPSRTRNPRNDIEIDEALIGRLRGGEDAAWRWLVSTRAGLVLAATRRAGLADADRDDVLQTAFAALHDSMDSLRDAQKLDSWLYSVAYRTALALLRRRKRETRVELIDDQTFGGEVAAESGVHEALETVETARRVRSAVEKLDGRCRLLIEALYLEDPPSSYEAISREHDIPMGSIGPTRARCLQRLQKLLGEVSDAPSTETTQARADHSGRPSGPEETGALDA